MDRLTEVLSRTASKLPSTLARALTEFSTPVNVLATLTLMEALADVQLTPAGPFVDGFLLAVTVYYVGSLAGDVLGDLYEAAKLTITAKSHADLDGAATALADAIKILTVVGFTYLLGRFLANRAATSRKAAAAAQEEEAATAEVRATQPRSFPPAEPNQLPAKSSPAAKIERYARPPAASMSNDEARSWYHNELDRINRVIDKGAPLEQQAKQAHALRNEVKLAARDAMRDRFEADKLNRDYPPATWDEQVSKQQERGYSGDDIYRKIIEGSEKSNPEMDAKIGVKRFR